VELLAVTGEEENAYALLQTLSNTSAAAAHKAFSALKDDLIVGYHDGYHLVSDFDVTAVSVNDDDSTSESKSVVVDESIKWQLDKQMINIFYPLWWLKAVGYFHIPTPLSTTTATTSSCKSNITGELSDVSTVVADDSVGDVTAAQQLRGKSVVLNGIKSATTTTTTAAAATASRSQTKASHTPTMTAAVLSPIENDNSNNNDINDIVMDANESDWSMTFEVAVVCVVVVAVMSMTLGILMSRWWYLHLQQ